VLEPAIVAGDVAPVLLVGVHNAAGQRPPAALSWLLAPP